MRTFILTEEQLKYYTEATDVLKEYGAIWGKSDNGVSLRVDSDPNVDNNSNKLMKVDTRVFGDKNDILHGKSNSRQKNLSDFEISKRAQLTTYQNLIKWIQNGRKGEFIPEPGLDTVTANKLDKAIKEKSDEELLASAEKIIDRISLDSEIYTNKINRVSNSENDKVMRYNMFTVPGTNIKCVALFTMSDFNFSDAIKHGKLRPNNKIDDILGYDTGNTRNSDKINVTYDDNIEADVLQNFSLKNVEPGHFKQQYPNGGYTSINQFLDKSIVYGANVLKEIGYHPDYIVSAPSSSKFNEYFCTNLSAKTGSEYVKDFFQRNIINVKLADGADVSTLKAKGLSDIDIQQLTSAVKNAAFNEINYMVCRPIIDFVMRNQKSFATIPSKEGAVPKRGRMANKLNLDQIMRVLCRISYGTALVELEKDEFIQYIVKVITYKSDDGKISKKSVNEMWKNIMAFSGMNKEGRLYKEYLEAHYQFTDILEQYINKLTEGFVPDFKEKYFKITSIDKRLRNYLQGLYVIADRNMTNGELQNRFRNAKFLIYDEDVNSGATLRLVVDALNEKLPDGFHQILCMANAYSNSGR